MVFLVDLELSSSQDWLSLDSAQGVGSPLVGPGSFRLEGEVASSSCSCGTWSYHLKPSKKKSGMGSDSNKGKILWVQSDFSRNFGGEEEGGPRVLNKIVDFGGPKWHLDSKALLGLSLNFTKILRKAHMSQYMW